MDRILTNSLRTIKKYFPRFLSLVIMSMLGVFTFVGLRSTAPDMIKTLSSYLDNYNTYDFKIVSTMGLTDDDIESLKNLSYINFVEGIYSKDILINISDEDYVINVSSLPKNINKLKLINGHMPSQDDEIVVEENLLIKNNLKIGDKLKIESGILNKSLYTITGTISSTLYYNNSATNNVRGNTSIGTGVVNYYSYVPSSSFNIDYYTSIYLTVDNDYETNSSKYNNLINNVKDEIESIKSLREDIRYDSIKNESKNKVDELNDKVNKELESSLKNIIDGKKSLDSYLKKLNEYNNYINESNTKLQNVKITLNKSRKELNKVISKNNIDINSIDKTINLLNEELAKLQESIKNLNQDSNEYIVLNEQIKSLQNKISILIEVKEKNTKLNLLFDDYEKNVQELNKKTKEYNTEVNKYNLNLKKYNESLYQYNIKSREAKLKVSDAYDKLNLINKPTWYIYDRTNYETYNEYIDDTNSINNLSSVFPSLFFLVSILISLISMNRMVEDDRGEIGTLKSLGFSNVRIMNKYLLFSLLATIIGTIIGSVLGTIIIPKMIYEIYKILFSLPSLNLCINKSSILIGFIVSLVCVCGTSILTVMKVVKEKPASLMRPKAPKNGKRVIIEKISFIWNRLKFSNKITIRNLFRYKKRVIATIIGISGCTGLILCGFGIRDAIVDIAYNQYGKIFTFDGLMYVDSINDDVKNLLNNKYIKNSVNIQNVSAKVDDTEVKLYVTESNDELKNMMNLIDYKTNEIKTLKDNEVMITEKLAIIKDLKVGDEIEVLDVNNKLSKYKISGIVKNHINHYIFLTKNTYESHIGKFSPNVIYFNITSDNDLVKEELSSMLLHNDNVINVSYVSELTTKVLNMLKSLNEVVVILIVLASLLSFVVLYNLSNININERKREIATLKVLGFYNKEVDNYITKENIILTIVGITLGLIFGYYLTNIVISTVEIEKARFLRGISIYSYIISALISVLFTVIVNIVTHFSLKKIDMIESLKSVE